MYIFQVGHLVLDDQLGCYSLGKTISPPLKIKDIVYDTDVFYCSLQEALISDHFFHLTGFYFESCETDLITTEQNHKKCLAMIICDF